MISCLDDLVPAFSLLKDYPNRLISMKYSLMTKGLNPVVEKSLSSKKAESSRY
jgi:hypothetical protein